MKKLWHRLRRKSPVVRKSAAYARKLPRAARRLWAQPGDFITDPPILANSFPKSGTHLLVQALEALPGATYYGSFIASTPSVTFRERSVSQHLRLIRRLVPGELVPAHLFHSQLYDEALSAKNTIHYFIYRDPRDVAVSEAYYLTYMNRWHRLHKYFARHLTTMDDRIMAAIRGIGDEGFPYDYPNIARRFERYAGWLETPNVLAVRFEDLVNSVRREDTLRAIVAFFQRKRAPLEDAERIVAGIVANIDPQRSHTFREGNVGGWRRVFKQEHIEAMKEVAGSLLITLGYERDLDW